jgi:hypothetical protein
MALHFHIRKPHAYIVVVVVKIAYLAINRVYTLIQHIIGLRMYRRDVIYARCIHDNRMRRQISWSVLNEGGHGEGKG